MNPRAERTTKDRTQRMDTIDDARAARLRDRLKRRLLIAAVAGPVIGVVVGLLVGSVAFQVGGLGFVMVLVGCVIFTTAVALLVASYSSLESPDPGAEPSQVERPIADRPGATRTEAESRDDAVRRSG
jgi:cation transporter-like permease